MERFGITATQRHRADVLGIQRLPTDRHFWLLRVVRRVHGRLKREESRRQHRRCVVAVPFLALGKVNLEAVEPGEVPRGAGKRYPYFLVDSPDITVHTEALTIH